jgi:lysophospholipid acyltransferase (LPLAT)-like uncharacterized protein
VGFGKSLLAKETVQAALAGCVAGYIRLVDRTSRWTVVNGEYVAKLKAENKPSIVCFWHGRMLLLPCSWRSKMPFKMLMSLHRDGRMIAQVIDHFGQGAIVGSTSRGGASALRAILRALGDGTVIGFTPDGPRGPRMRASSGIVVAAKLAQVPIMPVTYGAKRRRMLGSWDRFIVPRPFNRCALVWGDPIHVPADADADALERARLEVERSLNEITRQADTMFGLETPPPAEAETAATGARP